MKTQAEIEGMLIVANDNLLYLRRCIRREMVNKKHQNPNLIKSLERQIIEVGQEIKTLNLILGKN